MRPAPSVRRPSGRLLATAAALGILLGAGVACGGDDGGGDATATTATADAGSAGDGDAGAGSEEEEAALTVLVTNDDGYETPAIDALTTALDELDGVEVVVVAPLEGRSGTGGTYTEGPVDTEDVETLGGIDVVGVDGYPADAVRVALDEMEVEADLVVSGINEGQNIGPLVDISGTVGAARAGVARGVPALAVSSGRPDVADPQPDDFDADAAVEQVLTWLEENRAALEAGEAPVEVANLNVPSCPEGEVRDRVEVPVGDDGRQSLSIQDCTSTLEDPADDIEALNNGFATLTIVPDDPEMPYQPG